MDFLTDDTVSNIFRIVKSVIGSVYTMGYNLAAMMESDNMGERRQVNHTPTIALSIAAVLLLIVGALSYKDYLKTRYDKEYAEKETRLMQMHGYPGNVVPGPQSPVPVQPTLQNPALVAPVAPAPIGFQAPPTDLATAPVVTPTAPPAGLQYESSLPVPNDPAINKARESLEQAREQSQLNQERYNQLTGNVDVQAREAALATAAASEKPITSALPDFLREAVENPPGGNQELESRLLKMREQVVNSPSLGKVTSYDKDWGIVTFNAGASQGVKVDQRFAIRRGSDILGWIKVDQVEPNQSIAVLVTKNRESDTAAKPEVGDDLIDFELF